MLTAVGLLPIAVAGIDIDELMAGAADAMEPPCPLTRAWHNPAWQYAAARNCLYDSGQEGGDAGLLRALPSAL